MRKSRNMKGKGRERKTGTEKKVQEEKKRKKEERENNMVGGRMIRKKTKEVWDNKKK